MDLIEDTGEIKTVSMDSIDDVIAYLRTLASMNVVERVDITRKRYGCVHGNTADIHIKIERPKTGKEKYCV